MGGKNNTSTAKPGPWQVLPGNSVSGPQFNVTNPAALPNNSLTTTTQNKQKHKSDEKKNLHLNTKTAPSENGKKKSTNYKKIDHSSAPVLSERTRYVIQAFQAEINRLSEKLNHWFFKWFTWDAPMVQEKIDALKEIKSLITLDENKIDGMIEKICETTTEKLNESVPMLVNYYKIKQHRQGFLGQSATQENLIEAFKYIPR